MSISVVCGVVAALSPGNKWQRNLVDAEVAIAVVLQGGGFEDFKTATYPQNKIKAINIIQGSDPLSTLGGNKTSSFYRNLTNPKDKHVVTVDGHAICVALGERKPLKDVGQLSDKQYELFCVAYREATALINAESLDVQVIPNQVQAITWLYWRLIHNITSESNI